jgi:hypothetical protein
MRVASALALVRSVPTDPKASCPFVDRLADMLVQAGRGAAGLDRRFKAGRVRALKLQVVTGRMETDVDGQPRQANGSYSERPAFLMASKICAGVVPALTFPGTSATTPGACSPLWGVSAASSAFTRSLILALPLSSTIATV